MKKVNFGCGGNRLEGWENYDLEIDISKPLPFPDGTTDLILAEHVVEHVTPCQAWRFFEECHRILKPGGKIRICVPDMLVLCRLYDQNYLQVAGVRTIQEAVKAMVCSHGHQAIWTEETLTQVLILCGFDRALPAEYGQSHWSIFVGVDGHGKVVGDEIARMETTVVEAIK